MRMRMIAVAGVAILPLLLTACGGSSGGSTAQWRHQEARRQGQGRRDPAGCGHLAPLGEQRPAGPEEGDHGRRYTAIIQNATKSVDKFAQLCDGMINQGVAVLMIVNLDNDSGAACEKKALDSGIKSIDYDRLTLGGSADYYVSFDNVQVGKLMGDGLIACLDAKKKTKANIVMIDGDPTDNNAALFKQGYVGALKPKVDSGDYKIIGDQTGKWDATVAQTTFEQIYNQNKGRSTGSSRPTTPWPAASSRCSRTTSSPERSRSPARTHPTR